MDSFFLAIGNKLISSEMRMKLDLVDRRRGRTVLLDLFNVINLIVGDSNRTNDTLL